MNLRRCELECEKYSAEQPPKVIFGDGSARIGVRKGARFEASPFSSAR
jgi:hypothetical protein